jgi:hypothetical protein
MASPSRRRLFSIVAALAAVACLSPTLPLPPPVQPEVSGPDETGTVHLSGKTRLNSWIFAIDRANQQGVFQAAQPDGAYDLTLTGAEIGDEVVMWYELDGDGSEPLTFTLKAPKAP